MKNQEKRDDIGVCKRRERKSTDTGIRGDDFAMDVSGACKGMDNRVQPENFFVSAERTNGGA